MRVIVLRWGHRPRDFRVTSHVALTARAFGASGIIIADVSDKTIEKTVRKVVEEWGGPFSVEMGIPWRRCVKEWRDNGGVTVHLTVYGENIQTSDVMNRIRSLGRDLLILIGSRKVPSEFYKPEFSDFNVAVGNQPHSEVAALAVFLDRLFNGEELSREFSSAKLRVFPSRHGKKILKVST
ncbi:MAG: tRNA (cytidine(56)-2'-O)-methyltransferase [Candidatus Bathyarchaeia archaeon]